MLDVKPQEGEQSAKVKVKVRVNIHGIFLVSSAARIEKHEKEVEVPKDAKKTDGKKKEGVAISAVLFCQELFFYIL